jgi:hypothetical protein
VAEALVVIEELYKSFQHMGRKLEVLKGINLNICRPAGGFAWLGKSSRP